MVGATKYCDATGANCVTPWGGSPLYIYPRSGICAAFLGTSPTCQTVSCNTTCYYDCAGGCCPLNDCMTFGCSSSTPQACAGTYVGHLMP
jgi:hypothetical protein